MKVLLALLLLLLLALQYRLWFGDGSLQDVWRLREQALASQAEVESLRQRNQALAAEVADLKSGMAAIEERARAELGMIDKDETFYQFVLEQSVRDRPYGTTREASREASGEGSREASHEGLPVSGPLPAETGQQ